MSIEKQGKLKNLHHDWPKNAILTTAGLRSKGYSDQLIQRYCHSGWLKRVGVGAYIRQSDQATWQGGVYAIQQELERTIHIGGLTALEMSGLGHFLGLSPEKITYLYNTAATKHVLPGWFDKYFAKEENISFIKAHIFNDEIGLQAEHIGDLEVILSQPERAILEALYLVPKQLSVEHASHLVENLQTIRPAIMQQLLQSCRHILIKRLFLCLADLCQLPVLKYLDIKKIDLGSGERTVAPGGKYFAKYKLVLPYSDEDDLKEE